MTREQKDLLLKDLCARIPYGVKVQVQNEAGYDVTFQLSGYSMGYFYVNGNAFEEDEIKPYLRPMSSMTEEECSAVNKIDTKRLLYSAEHLTRYIDGEIIDYFNQRMLDWRLLIPQGLALEAPKDIYCF